MPLSVSELQMAADLGTIIAVLHYTPPTIPVTKVFLIYCIIQYRIYIVISVRN